MHSLPIFVRLNGRPVILLGDGEAAAAKRRLLERAGAKVVDEEAQASLAIVAIEDDYAAEAAIARLKARGVLVNAVDRPSSCDFTLPAIVDRDPVLIAIGTGGASAGLAKALRQRLEQLLPASLGRIATSLGAARAQMRSRWPDPAERRRAIDAAFDPGGPLDPMGDAAPDAVIRWLGNSGEAATPVFRHFTVSSNDPDDLTITQARWLGQADTIYHTSRVAPAILNRARADAARIACEAPPTEAPQGMTVFVDRI